VILDHPTNSKGYGSMKTRRLLQSSNGLLRTYDRPYVRHSSSTRGLFASVFDFIRSCSLFTGIHHGYVPKGFVLPSKTFWSAKSKTKFRHSFQQMRALVRDGIAVQLIFACKSVDGTINQFDILLVVFCVQCSQIIT